MNIDDLKKDSIVICIKNVYNENTDIIIHKKGNKYKLYSDINLYDNGYYVYVETEKTTTMSFFGFFVNGNKTYFYDWLLFKDYFGNIKEIRRKKLLKINNLKN